MKKYSRVIVAAIVCGTLLGVAGLLVFNPNLPARFFAEKTVPTCAQLGYTDDCYDRRDPTLELLQKEFFSSTPDTSRRETFDENGVTYTVTMRRDVYLDIKAVDLKKGIALWSHICDLKARPCMVPRETTFDPQKGWDGTFLDGEGVPLPTTDQIQQYQNDGEAHLMAVIGHYSRRSAQRELERKILSKPDLNQLPAKKKPMRMPGPNDGRVHQPSIVRLA